MEGKPRDRTNGTETRPKKNKKRKENELRYKYIQKK